MTQVEVAELVAQDSAASIYFAVIALNVRHIHPTQLSLLTLHFRDVSKPWYWKCREISVPWIWMVVPDSFTHCPFGGWEL